MTFRLWSIILFLALPLQAEPPRYAIEAQALLGGQLEVRLKDGTRCNLLTETTAYEIEYDVDWKESIGQALHYAHVAERRAGVVLVMRSDKGSILPRAAQGDCRGVFAAYRGG